MSAAGWFAWDKALGARKVFMFVLMYGADNPASRDRAPHNPDSTYRSLCAGGNCGAADIYCGFIDLDMAR